MSRGREVHWAAALSVALVIQCAAMQPPTSLPTATSPTWSAVFGSSDVGKLPPGWRVLVTNGQPPQTTWCVAAESSLPGVSTSLALVENQGGRAHLNLCVAEEPRWENVDFSAAAQGDEGVGLVWRCRDERNYYVCRVNALEGNFSAFRMVNGERTRLADAPLPAYEKGRWYHIRVVSRGDQIECYLDGERRIQVRDAGLRGAGSFGVWTRADALGRFAELRATRLD